MKTTLLALFVVLGAQEGIFADEALDAQVSRFLKENRSQWRGTMSSGEDDAQYLYDLIIKNKYTRALEIGTFKAHGAIYMAWALSKTGGTLTTIEYDEKNYRTSVENIKNAGLSHIVEVKLGNAHDIVPALQDQYDFVFSDADKDWYINYFKDIAPKLTDDACIIADNTFDTWWNSKSYRTYVDSRKDFTTTHLPQKSMSLSCKK